jgi:hypothetical protein
MDNGGQFDTDKTANTRAGGTEIGIKMANGMTYTYSHLSQINPDVLMRYMGGENNIPISAGEYIGNIGGKPGVPGSGYSTTGSHLHLGMINSKGNKIDPESILSGLVDANGPIGVTHNFNVSVKLELTGEGADKLNSMTETQLKTFIKQTVEESAKENNSMNPTIRY